MFAGLTFTAQLQWNKAIQLSPMYWFAYVSVTVLGSPEAKSMIYISTFRISKSQVHFYIFSNYLFRFGQATSRKHLIMMATGQEMRSHQIEEIRPFGLIYE